VTGVATCRGHINPSRVSRQVGHEQPQIPDSESFRTDPLEQASVRPFPEEQRKGPLVLFRYTRPFLAHVDPAVEFVIGLGLTSIPPNSRAETADLTR
jgi:hypothetical protein